MEDFKHIRMGILSCQAEIYILSLTFTSGF